MLLGDMAVKQNEEDVFNFNNNTYAEEYDTRLGVMDSLERSKPALRIDESLFQDILEPC